MKALYISILACLTLAGCGAVQPPPSIVTVTKSVPVYPPDALYSEDSPCKQLAPRTSGTVTDLGIVGTVQRYTIQDCLDDRAALRQWKVDMKKKAAQ